MNVLRDVIAKFSVVVDDAPLKQLDKRIEGLKDNYGALGFMATAALAGAAAASYKFIQAASGVTEQQNKIQALFGKPAQQEIIAWSKTVEASMGRSEYAFQSSFSDFAAFLDPMQIGVEKTIEMSKRLAELKVDLASFYNTTEEDAQMRLFSGMAGETEAVRRLGIDISDTALANLYNSKENPLDPQHRPGVGGAGQNRGKGLASLTLQQKSLLRYAKILKDTHKAQGDAARTASGWANTLKRLTDRAFRLEVALGKLVEGPGTKFLNLLEEVVVTSEKVVVRTKAVQTAIGFLGAAAVVWTGRWAVANQALLVSLLPIAAKLAVITAAFLAVEDAFTFFSDPHARTGLGKLITAITGIKTPLVAVKDLFADINKSIASSYDWMRKWVPLVGNALRISESLMGGRSYWDETPSQVEGSDERKKKRMETRNAALAAGDMKTWVDNAEADMTYEEAQQTFLKRRAGGVEMGLYKPQALDYGNPYSQGKLTAVANGKAGMVTGAITVAPVTHVHVSGGPGMQIGEIERIVKKTNAESAQQAAALLGRRGAR